MQRSLAAAQLLLMFSSLAFAFVYPLVAISSRVLAAI
jgi:hypothetical protein